MQQGREVLCGPLLGGEVGIARNAQGLQLALATDGQLEDFAERLPQLELLAQAKTDAPDQIANAVAPGRFQIALLTPTPASVTFFDLAPVQPPFMGSTSQSSTAGELYVVTVAGVWAH